MGRWHIQVCHREWVIWRYGPGTGGNIAPAETILSIMGDETRLPFTLPEHRENSGLPPPQEIRRVTCWGWRVRTNDGIHDCGWHLADSKDVAIKHASDWLSGKNQNLIEALEDVREYSTGLW